MSQNGQTHFKNLAAFRILYLKFKFRQFGAKLKFHQIYLKMCTPVSLKALNTNVTKVSYNFLFKTKIWAN